MERPSPFNPKNIKTTYKKLSIEKFDLYYLKLIQLCELMGVEVVEKHTEYNGYLTYIRPNKPVVRVSPKLSRGKFIATLLHELGHYRADIRNGQDKPTLDAIDRAYNKKKLSILDKKLILDCEAQAWKEAEILAEELGIKLGVWFSSFRDKCLSSYL